MLVHIEGHNNALVCGFVDALWGLLPQSNITTRLMAEPSGVFWAITNTLTRADASPRARALLEAADRACHSACLDRMLGTHDVVLSEHGIWRSFARWQEAGDELLDFLAAQTRDPDLVLYIDSPPESDEEMALRRAYRETRDKMERSGCRIATIVAGSAHPKAVEEALTIILDAWQQEGR